MRTVVDELRSRADLIKLDAKALFLDHSKPYRHRRDMIRFRTHGWHPLSDAGHRAASKVRVAYSRLSEVLQILVKSSDSRTVNDLGCKTNQILEWIDHSNDHFFDNGQEAFDGFSKEFDAQLAVLEQLFDPQEGRQLYVPDTNAILANPAMETWTFDDSDSITLVLTSTVLSELDNLKVHGRNQDVRDKAKQLVRQLHEYRRRGSLEDGVPLLKNKVSIKTIAIEPDFENSLSWLDSSNNDDRILASFIEVMRLHPRCMVRLVTGDFNLTNKADYAGLPCVLPPEPKSE